MKKLSIIIPVYNQSNYTKACLNDLMELNSDVEIIIVDDASTDNTKSVVESFGDRVKYIKNNTNIRFAKTVNNGYAHSIGEFILFLNNDIRVKADKKTWPYKLIEAAKDGSLVGPTGGLLDSSFNFVCEANKIMAGNFYISGWCLLGSRETFERLKLPNYSGPFEESYGHYFEDADLSMRATKLGMSLKIVDIPVKHFGKISTKPVNVQQLYLSAQKKFIEKWK